MNNDDILYDLRRRLGYPDAPAGRWTSHREGPVPYFSPIASAVSSLASSFPLHFRSSVTSSHRLQTATETKSPQGTVGEDAHAFKGITSLHGRPCNSPLSPPDFVGARPIDRDRGEQPKGSSRVAMVAASIPP